MAFVHSWFAVVVVVQLCMPHPRGLEIFHGRRLGPLVSAWIGAAIVAGIVFWIDRQQPAFHEILLPMYWLIVVMLIITTGRWLRSRQGDRRDHERRKNFRRDTDSHPLP
jgi:peptidoglycan/LPS O-acetylase OafA/YrhL